MCCFSRSVPYVAGTKIFARSLDDGRQVLVYSMAFVADEDLAMILPLPVPPGSPEDAVRFVDLSGYDRFFDDMERGFPVEMVPVSRSLGAPESAAEAPKLEVHEVGDYEASFVPTQADFDRLDDRFKLSPEVWAQLPQYAAWGFAVFKLKGKAPEAPGFFARLFGRRPRLEPRKVHPMAFEFPRRNPATIFFPTVHVHDGQVHPEAIFDHQLYCQDRFGLPGAWSPSNGAIGQWMDVSRSQGLIDPSAHVFRRTMRGFFVNQDQLVDTGMPPAAGHG